MISVSKRKKSPSWLRRASFVGATAAAATAALVLAADPALADSQASHHTVAAFNDNSGTQWIHWAYQPDGGDCGGYTGTLNFGVNAHSLSNGTLNIGTAALIMDINTVGRSGGLNPYNLDIISGNNKLVINTEPTNGAWQGGHYSSGNIPVNKVFNLGQSGVFYMELVVDGNGAGCEDTYSTVIQVG